MPTKILIVDDDLYLRELYEEVLKNEGYDVDIAKDGKEGFEKITTNSYNLILLDVMLPQLDGLGILTKLKESQSPVPLNSIILLTNLTHDPAIKEALKMGVHSCLTKAEMTPDQFLAKVKEALGEGTTPPTAVPTVAPAAPAAEITSAPSTPSVTTTVTTTVAPAPTEAALTPPPIRAVTQPTTALTPPVISPPADPATPQQ